MKRVTDYFRIYYFLIFVKANIKVFAEEILFTCLFTKKIEIEDGLKRPSNYFIEILYSIVSRSIYLIGKPLSLKK